METIFRFAPTLMLTVPTLSILAHLYDSIEITGKQTTLNSLESQLLSTNGSS